MPGMHKAWAPSLASPQSKQVRISRDGAKTREYSRISARDKRSGHTSTEDKVSLMVTKLSYSDFMTSQPLRARWPQVRWTWVRWTKRTICWTDVSSKPKLHMTCGDISKQPRAVLG